MQMETGNCGRGKHHGMAHCIDEPWYQTASDIIICACSSNLSFLFQETIHGKFRWHVFRFEVSLIEGSQEGMSY
jgi:hypothetical protein